MIRTCGSASILHEASAERAEEGRGDRFFPCEGERAAPSFPPSRKHAGRLAVVISDTERAVLPREQDDPLAHDKKG